MKSAVIVPSYFQVTYAQGIPFAYTTFFILFNFSLKGVVALKKADTKKWSYSKK